MEIPRDREMEKEKKKQNDKWELVCWADNAIVCNAFEE